MPENLTAPEAGECQQPERQERRGGDGAGRLGLAHRLAEPPQLLGRQRPPLTALLELRDVARRIELRRHEPLPVREAKDGADDADHAIRRGRRP